MKVKFKNIFIPVVVLFILIVWFWLWNQEDIRSVLQWTIGIAIAQYLLIIRIDDSSMVKVLGWISIFLWISTIYLGFQKIIVFIWAVETIIFYFIAVRTNIMKIIEVWKWRRRLYKY